MKKNALGRGLDALFPQADYQGSLRDISVSEIDLNPGQPRKEMDKEALEQLAASIREVGMLQPILVQREGTRYRIIAGERRFRAARLAGLASVPCIEKDMEAQEQMLAALIENLQREDLNPIDQARAIRALMQEGSLTQEQAAQRLGKSRPALANALRLLKLPAAVQEMLRSRQLSEGHARALAGLEDSGMATELARRAVAQGLSVRQMEQLAKDLDKARPARRLSALAPELRDFAQRLQRLTGARTGIKGNLEQGRIQISYRTKEELESIYRALEDILP